MLILAGVTINLTLGENGIFQTAQKAAKNYKEAEDKETAELYGFETLMNDTINGIYVLNGSWSSKNNVNKPKVSGTGLTPVTLNSDGSYGIPNIEEDRWYSYDGETNKWANARTKDGSLWVWIPRFAYKITYTNVDDKSAGGIIDVVFLQGTSDNYYDENGVLQTAKRATTSNMVPDTETGYTVHPAFTNESSIKYANGGWDSELAGIWVAKFEAGYASGNNEAKVQASKVNYTQASAWVPATEAGTSSDTTKAARNWLDGEYGVYNSETGKYEWKNGEMAIKYPTFQGITYAMNYININDAYNISKALTGANNIYGLSSSQADSHLMKNSEWGAVAYLSKSKYGLNGTNIYINNVTLGNSTQSVYAVTGCCTSTDNADQGATTTTIADINARTASGVYVWTEEKGQRASSTGTIYGVYDMSGGAWEYVMGVLADSSGNPMSGRHNLNNSGAFIFLSKNSPIFF